MDKPITVGDLVVVVKAHCEKSTSLGKIYRVAKLRRSPNQYCGACGSIVAREIDVAESGAIGGMGLPFGQPLSWIKRIPPFPELADERHDEEITA